MSLPDFAYGVARAHEVKWMQPRRALREAPAAPDYSPVTQALCAVTDAVRDAGDLSP